MNLQVNFILLGVVIPLVIGTLLIFGRTSLRRALILVSAGSLVLMAVEWGVFGLEYGQGAFALGYLRPPVSGLSLVHHDALTIAVLLAIGAWVLALADASRSRRWAWFSTLFIATVVSYSAVGIDTNESFMREIPAYDDLMQTHFLAVSIVLGSLTALIALATLLYASLALPRHANEIGAAVD